MIPLNRLTAPRKRLQANDVFFAIHAVVMTLVTISQCFMYERGAQRVSTVARVLLAIFWSFAGVSLIVASAKSITWLLYLNFWSYIKLAITLIKYIPQVRISAMFLGCSVT